MIFQLTSIISSSTVQFVSKSSSWYVSTTSLNDSTSDLPILGWRFPNLNISFKAQFRHDNSTISIVYGNAMNTSFISIHGQYDMSRFSIPSINVPIIWPTNHIIVWKPNTFFAWAGVSMASKDLFSCSNEQWSKLKLEITILLDL